MTGSVTRAREAGLELARMLAALLWVAATSALVIAALGALPGWIAGEGSAVRHAGSVQEAERRLGAVLMLPGYFPQRLAWPPSEIRLAGGRRGSAALTIVDRTGAPAIQILQSTAEGAEIAPPLLADRNVLRVQRTTVGPYPATLSAVLVAGQPWQELAWEQRGRAVLLRTRGDLDELYHMAHSTHPGGGR